MADEMTAILADFDAFFFPTTTLHYLDAFVFGVEAHEVQFAQNPSI